VETLRRGGGCLWATAWMLRHAGRMPKHAACELHHIPTKTPRKRTLSSPRTHLNNKGRARVPNPGRSRLPSAVPVAPRRFRYGKPSAESVTAPAVSIPSWRRASLTERRRRSMRGGTG
jgi:hypothetical protein